jgi:hypothetical protein
MVASGDRPQDDGAEMLRVHVRQRAFPNFADSARRSAGVDDQSLGHGLPQ